MNDNHWYPRDAQRYLTDTQWCDHATEVAHVRLIDTYYALGKPIKDIQCEIQNIGKIKDADYVRVRGNLERLGWKFTGGELRHRRIEETMSEMEENRMAQINRTKAATKARMDKRDEQRDVERNVVPTTTTTTTIETETSTKGNMSSATTPPLSEILEEWNAMAKRTGLPNCLVMSDKRRRTLQIRFKDGFFSANWRKALAVIFESSFLKGNNDRSWRASFDWFIQPDSVAKIIEGKYKEESKPFIHRLRDSVPSQSP